MAQKVLKTLDWLSRSHESWVKDKTIVPPGKEGNKRERESERVKREDMGLSLYLWKLHLKSELFITRHAIRFDMTHPFPTTVTLTPSKRGPSLPRVAQ